MSIVNNGTAGGGGRGGVGGGTPATASRRGATGIVTVSAINPAYSDDDDNRENHHVLREKLPPNTKIQSHYNDDLWLPNNDYVDDSELYQEKRKLQQELLNKNIATAAGAIHIRNQMILPTDAQYRYLDGEKDNKYLDRQLNNSKRKFRTRSESEQHELSGVVGRGTAGKEEDEKSWSPNGKQSIDNTNGNGGDVNKAATGAALRFIKLPPTPTKRNGAVTKGIISSDCTNHNKRQSPLPHRVLLYNNTSPRSPRNAGRRHHSHLLSPASSRGSSLTRVNENRRGRTTSPSPARATETAAEKFGHKSQSIARQSGGADAKLGEQRTHMPRSTIGDDYYDDKQDIYSLDDDFDLDRVSDFGDSYDSSSSSDSENGYRSHAYKLSHQDKLSTSPSSTYKAISNISSQSSSESLINPESLLVPSLFPHVPPYLSFSSNLSRGPDVPTDLYRILKFKVTNVMPKLVRNVLANSGVRLLKKTNDWMGTWGKHMKSPCFKTIRPYQKINHLPGSFKIGRKDACWKNLQKQMLKHGKKDFGFMPKTYIIPQDLNLLRKTWPKYAQRNFKWIIKPPASARGAGIRVVNRWAQIPKRRPLIVQKYIERPLLINGSKFDLRLYVLVTSVNPLRVFMYHNGLARFASVKYSDRADTLSDRCMHLTNYSINKLSSNYSKNDDVNACHGHKWTLKSLWSYLAERGVRTDRLWDAMRNLVLRTILAGENAIHSMIKMNVESKYSTFELFGFDVLLDAELIPWLLEVNISPSLHSELPLDAHVKAPLVQGVLNTALYNVPPKLSPEKQKEITAKMRIQSGPLCFDKRLYVNYLSRAEKLKHSQFTRKTLEDRDDYIDAILENLTPDDVRCLIVAEDEFARCAPLERIFPTYNTHKYLKYTEVPRYYNRLLDAWENRYAKNRSEGIAILREYCEDKYHLEVPPSPAKKQIKNRTRTIISVTPSTLALTTAVRSIKRRNRRRMISCTLNRIKIQQQGSSLYQQHQQKQQTSKTKSTSDTNTTSDEETEPEAIK